MGVHGLWELLAPVGRRVSVETLAGKKLAIDASIWMVQFMKAMRDEKGEMVRNAHLLGFFRRICKLLFLRTKPVFVFDGGTPALKRRTVIARRRQRENAQAKIRKTAEKLLLNHLKAMRLKELAHDLESQRQKNDAKGKNVIKDETGNAGNNLEEMNTMPSSCKQEELDELLAASLAADEDGNFAGNASTSGVGISVDEEEDDEDEEMILPAMSGKVDPAVLAALPPSMQLDLLVQMRERLMAENRQKYQKVKRAPAKFSELQIQAYLKTVAFRREIDQVQKSAAGKGMGGVQTSRIASEANREFIFSSSFSGDKEVLASAGVEGHSEKLPHKPSETSSVLLDSISSTNKSDAETGSVADNPGGVEDIETYQDERGQVRVSRVRAMGIRMTRDLQRNLDMMKEIEQNRMQSDKIVNTESILQKNEGGISRRLLEKFQHAETSYQGTDGSVVNRNDGITCRNENVMEISFEDDGGEKCLDGDDVLFAHLVAGDSLMSCSVDNSALKKHSFSPDSDFDWEEGVIEERVDGLAPAETSCTVKKGIISFQAEGSDDDSEVVWEDGDSYDLKCASPSPVETRKTVSKGALAEEADFQEAIRRSLKDLSGHESSDASFEDEKPEEHREMVHKTMGARSGLEEIEKLDPNELQENVIQTEKLSYEVVSEARRPEVEAKTSKVNTADLCAQVAISPDITERLVEKSHARYPTSDAEPFHKDKSEGENLLGEMECKESVFPAEEAGVPLIVEQLLDTSKTGSKVFPSFSNFSADGSQNSDPLLGENFHAIPADAQPNISEVAANGSLLETTEHREAYVEESTTNHDTVQKLLKEEDCDNPPDQRGDEEEESIFKDDIENPIEVTESGLEEEIHNLSQERIELGDQQRKLERNMESVSSEMFAECQELLQMFGLPYVFAPMEAEAQCAYMELTSLVDGVVTDDSDAFLFGARSVYKNIFDDRKYVETYLMKDIENELGLSRDKLIRMALLLGSDYTEGVSGIGIVNAIEVVNAFPEEDGFRKFREWIESPDPAILGKVDAQTGASSRKRGSKVFDNSIMEGLSALDQAVTQITDCIDETKRIFIDKHRNVSKNWHIPSTFPNEAVISAYASPQVDNSTEPFSWGKPDHFVLRKLCWEKFGWSMQKADELLVPVLKEYNKHETQLRLEAFYTFNERFAKIRSKRITKAVKGIRGNMTTELMDDFAQETSKSRKRRKARPGKCQDDKSEKGLSGKDDRVAKDESNLEKKATKMQSRKRKHAEPVPSEAKNQESVKPSGGRRNTSQGLNARGHRGNGRDRAAGRGRNKKNHDMAFAGSSDDGSHSDSELEMQVEIMEGTQGVRKSTRIRKAVKYTLDDLETNEPAKEDQHEMNSNNEETVQEESSEGHDIIGDDTAGPGDENQNKVGDTSFMEVSNGDYLEMGGGFCMDDAEPEFETGHLSSGQKGDSSLEAEFPQGYLRVGGGFCSEEDEMAKDSDKCAPRPAGTFIADDSKQKLDHLTPVTGDCYTLARCPPQRCKEYDSEMAPPKSLSAMPALRRKRRKS